MGKLLRLGRKQARFDKRTLKLEDYISADLQFPRKVVWQNKIPNWGMMLNDQLGDCTCAAAGHMIMNWTANAGVLVTPNDNQILSAYEAVGGYNPNAAPDANGNNPTDNGAVELDVLKYWQGTGIAGHKIGAYVSIDPKNRRHLKLAIWLFGGIYTGVNLTQADMDATNANQPWKYTTGSSIGGHAIPALGFNQHGFQFITWGAVQTATPEWVANQTEEVYALISADWLENNGNAPSGFDAQQLAADLKSVQN
jgi:hypothetical protein